VSELTNPWEPWQRLIDSIGSYYRGGLFEARHQAKPKLADLDEEELGSIASQGRRIASSLDEESARLTVSLTDDRDRHSKLGGELQHEAQRLARQVRRTLLPRDRRQARADAAELAAQAEHHRRLAAEAHERLRELGNAGRHLYPWFERHEDVLGRGLAAELVLEAAHSAVYHVLAAPGIASLTAACLTSDRAIDIGRLEQLVKDAGDHRQLCCSRWRPSSTTGSRGCRSASSCTSLTAKTSIACSRRSRWSSGARSTSRGRLTISGSAPLNPRN
jgi:hypothetical protein